MGFIDRFFKKPAATFEKISLEEFITDWQNIHENDPAVGVLENIYADIKLPERSTTGSAGYNFTVPFSFKLKLGESIVIPTGIRCKMDDSLVLFIAPRSGQGTKYRVSLLNTIGVIDSDYYHADNEGHILVKISYDGCPVQEKKLRSTKSHKMFKDGEIEVFLEGEDVAVFNPPELRFEAGKGFAQGVFLRYGRANEKVIKDTRKGGFGSTGK